MKDDIAKNKLLEVMVAQAKLFVERMGEFYPFGCVITNSEKIKPIGAYSENDCPESQVLIEILDNKITKGILEEEYHIGAIGVDVYINGENGEKSNSLEIRIKRTENKDIWDFMYVSYSITDKGVYFDYP